MVETVGLMALFTVEMNVQVVVYLVMMAMTKLIAHSVATVLYHVY